MGWEYGFEPQMNADGRECYTCSNFLCTKISGD